MTAPVIRTVGVPKEIKNNEYRVAMTPDGVREFERLGINVFVETGAGAGASFRDADYEAAGESANEFMPYGLTFKHKHLPELQAYAQLTHPPLFTLVLSLASALGATSTMAHRVDTRRIHRT